MVIIPENGIVIINFEMFRHFAMTLIIFVLFGYMFWGV